MPTRTSYLAHVAGVRHRVDPDSTVDVWVLRRPGVLEAHGAKTWRAVAESFGDHTLVTSVAGSFVPIACHAFTEEEIEVLSSDERALIVETLRETGQVELADRCDRALDRITKTDPPPPRPTPTAVAAAKRIPG